MRSSFGRRCKGGSLPRGWRQRAEREHREAEAEEQKAATAKLEGPTCGVVSVADRTPSCTTWDFDGQRVWWERSCVQVAKQQEGAKEQAARTFKPSGPRRTSGRLLVRVETIPGLSAGLRTEPCQCEEFFSPSRLPAEKFFPRCFSTPFLQGRHSTFLTLLSCMTPMDVQTACPELCVGAPAPSTSTDSLVPHRCHRCKCHYHTHTLTG